MIVKKTEVLATCNKCGCTEFYTDNNSNYWCVDCCKPHKTYDFDYANRDFEGDFELITDLDELEEE